MGRQDFNNLGLDHKILHKHSGIIVAWVVVVAILLVALEVRACYCKEHISRAWRDGLKVKSIVCSSREPSFDSKHQWDSLRMCVTPG